MKCVTCYRRKNGNFYDIPISPNLKSRVRQRLFALVNHIEGYEPKCEKIGILTNKEFCSHDIDTIHEKKSDFIKLERTRIRPIKDVPKSNDNQNENPDGETENANNFKTDHGNTNDYNACDCFHYRELATPFDAQNVTSQDIFNLSEKFSAINILEEYEDKLRNAWQLIGTLKLKILALESEQKQAKVNYDHELKRSRMIYEGKHELYEDKRDEKAERKCLSKFDLSSSHKADSVTRDLTRIKLKHESYSYKGTLREQDMSSLHRIEAHVNLLKDEIEEIKSENMKLKIRLRKVKSISEKINQTLSIKKRGDTISKRNTKMNTDLSPNAIKIKEFQELIKDHENFFTAQIREYEKAIKILKRRCRLQKHKEEHQEIT